MAAGLLALRSHTGALALASASAYFAIGQSENACVKSTSQLSKRAHG